MTNLDAPIVAVVVYTDRARVTRRGKLRLLAGEHTLTLADLPVTIEERSIRAGGRGAGVKILGVESALRYVARPPEEPVAALRQQLEALQDQDRALIDDDAAQEARLAFLNTLRDSGATDLAKGLAYGRAKLDDVEALLHYLMRERDAVAARRREIATQRRDLVRELEALRGRLAQVQQVESRERREIRVALDLAHETELELEISYIVAGASWEPGYDIRLAERVVTLTYLAQIRQQTGEDWPAVQLSLSTARPAASATIPELTPWYVDVPRPPRQAYPAMPPQAAPTLAGGMMARPAPAEPLAEAPPPPPPPAEIAQATIEGGGAAITYRVARPVAVPSDGSPHRTSVTTLDLEARLDYVTAPKLAAEAYLRAKVKNSSAFILLPGAASIFHDADFVGATRLETVAPNEEFEVQLGVDNRIKVERTLIRRAVDKTLIGNTRRTQFAYKITITNLLAAPAHVTLLDQLPVARHESIKVKLLEVMPKPAEQNDLNILRWEFDLAPQEQRETIFAFSAEHPRELAVLGLG